MVGARICLELLQQGKQVRGFRRENSSNDILKRTFNGQEHLLSLIEWHTGDVTDVLSVKEAMAGINEVYHCAAIVSFDDRLKNEIEQINVTGTTNVVNMALETGVSKFCHISSVAAVGRDGNNPEINESISWKSSKHNTWYAVTKYAAEREVWRGIEEGLHAVIVNPSIILGPGNWNSGSGLLFRAVHEGLKFYPTGTTGFVDVRDVANCCISLMNKSITNERFILNSENIPYQSLFEFISDSMKRPAPFIKVSPLMSALAWRFEKLRSVLTGSYPKLTKETANTSMHKWHYDNSKIIDAIGCHFIPVKDSCHQWAEEFERSFGS